MKTTIKIIMLFMSFYLNAQTAQPMSVSICGCPNLVMQNSDSAYLQFESINCNIGDYDDPAIIYSNEKYILSDQLGQWWMGDNRYRTAYTQLDEFIPYNVNDFTLFFANETYYCHYINGQAVDSNLSIVKFELEEEPLLYKVFSIDGRNFGEMFYEEVFNLPNAIYILRNDEKRKIVKIRN